jgi:hypothetical protein
MAVSAGAHGGTGISRGPNTTTNPYVIPVADGVHIKSLLTVSDAGAAGNGYEMTGIPDGLGAREWSGHDLILNMNQELNATVGAVRAHGQRGAFVSTREIDTRTFDVEKGADLIRPTVRYWNYLTQTYEGTASPGA